MNAARSFLIVVPDETLLFEAAGVADILHQANEHAPHEAPYRVTLATGNKNRLVRGRSGLSLLADHSLDELSHEGWHSIMITGSGRNPVEQEIIIDWFRRAAPHAQRVVSACTGALLLARAGLLDGRRATTHWRRLNDLARLHPKVTVEPDAIYVRDDPVWTSAGASSAFDLALALVEEDLGHEVARQVARFLVLYLRRPGGQSQFSRFLENQAAGGPIRDLQFWALENLERDLSIEGLASQAAMSPRNFSRVFVKETGVTPAQFVENIRLEAARQRLEQGRESLDEVAARCGWGTSLTLRRVFEKHLGVTPSEYRARFGMI